MVVFDLEQVKVETHKVNSTTLPEPFYERGKRALSIIPSILPSSTDFLMVCAVSTMDSEIFFVALVAKVKM